LQELLHHLPKSGNLHIGTARTAYFNWLAARSTNGKFILRIDDTDKSRNQDIFLKDIIDSLDWLGLNYDLMLHQSDRSDIYKSYLDKIDPKYLKKDGDAIRLNLPLDIIRDNWKDNLSNKPIITSIDDRQIISDMVLIKSDGIPTYHFASVIDDIDMNINCIVRGIDHLSNTIKHITLYDILGVDIPDFYHTGLIHNMNGKKISKRDGAISVKDYKDMGYKKDAILNFLLRMGWGPHIDNKANSIINVDKAIQMFWTDGKMRSAPSKMDINKLNWFNKKY